MTGIHHFEKDWESNWRWMLLKIKCLDGSSTPSLVQVLVAVFCSQTPIV